MYAHPNTPVLPLEADTPHPSADELRSIIEWYTVFATDAESLGADEAFASVAAQAVGSLVLVQFYSFGKLSPEARQLRRETRFQLRTRAWADVRKRFPALVSLLACLWLGACGQLREVRAPERQPVGDVGEGLPGAEEPDSADATAAPGVEADHDAPAVGAAPDEPQDVPMVDQVDDPSLLALDASHCTGHWVDPSDVSTRLDAHPDTGLCSFACTWQEPKCRESWYGDVRCYPAHRARLEAVCASLGGTCQPASTGVSFCELAQ